MSRAAYAHIYGPTRGDLVRLADTSLLAEVERDFAHYGDELTTGAGKCMRDGEGFQPSGTYASGALDMVVQNATIIDAVAGIVKGDIEAHAHFLSPQQCHHALAGGTTTMIGMSPGPHFDVSCSGPNVLGQTSSASARTRSQ